MEYRTSWLIVVGLFLCMSFPAMATQTVSFSGTPLQLNQGALQLGESVPAVDLVDGQLRNVRVGGALAKQQVIATVLSLDTPVCQAEIKRLDELAQHSSDTQFVVVANVSPFQLASFSKQHNIQYVKLLSNFRAPQFNQLYGTRIEDSQLADLNTRAVFVVDRTGHLRYQQFTDELTRPLNYRELTLALRELPTAQTNYS